MSVVIDHVGIPAADPWASARFLQKILAEGEIAPEGPDGEMASLSVGHSALTYFELAAHEPHHVALRVTGPVLAGAIGRLRQRGLPFGNDPADPANGQTEDPLGGSARIYFHDPSGHLFELFVPAGADQ
jgi:catechol 2,3-dioxygenase-like lactoylglutathione lyase family enzyme